MGHCKMKHVQILSQVEKAISSNVDIVGITRVEKINITDNSNDVVPGNITPPGDYGVVDLRLILPISESV